MKLIINNVQSQLLIGGADFLIDVELVQNLRQYMSVDVPGAFFANKKLHYHWDGKKYFLTPGGKFATGFLPVLLKFIEEEYSDLEVEIIDQRENLPIFSPIFQSKIGPITVNDGYIHQKQLIEAYNHSIEFRGQQIYFPRGVVDAATNAGKTAVMAGIFLNLEGEQKMLVVIHRKTVYRELLEFFREVFGGIGEINDQYYTIGRRVTLCMIQSLYSKIEDPNVKKDLAGFTVLCVDEAHRAGAVTYTKTLVHCGAGMRVFVSGSAFDSDAIVSKMIIVGLSGPRLATVTKKEMMDKGISTPVTVHVHLCNTILRGPVLDYDDCIKKLIHESIERVSIVAQIIRNRQAVGPVLIFVEETQHGIFLYENLKDSFNIELSHSKDPDLIRKVDAFRAGELDCIITTGILKEGVNLPKIRTIIDCSGGQSKINIKQRMGRGERLEEGKTEVEYHDFYDIGRYISKHSIKRLKIYRSEGLEVICNFNEKDVKRLGSIVIN
jgi:superfamily II DNA or RNA helicase